MSRWLLNILEPYYSKSTVSNNMLLSVVGAIIAILCVRYIYNYVIFWRHYFKIPGPKAVPILGNAFNDGGSAAQVFLRDRKYAKEFKDIYATWGLTLAEVSFLHPSDIEKVLTNNAHNAKGIGYGILHSWLGTGLLTSVGEKWQKRRKILTPAFHFNILQEFVTVFNKETKVLTEKIEKQCHKPYVEVLDPISKFTLSSISETSMGVNLAESEENRSYLQAVHDMGTVISGRMADLWLFLDLTYHFSATRKLEQNALDVLHKTSRSLIETRKKLLNEGAASTSDSRKKRLAMLDLLLKYKQAGADIDEEGIREEVDTFMFGGHDTTSISLGFLSMLLANNPSVQKQVYEEIIEILGEDPENQPTYKDLQELKYMERCIKESLRLYPPAAVISRMAGEAFTTKDDYYIPKDTMLNIFIYDLHHREDIYEDPAKFDPDRFLPENVATRHKFAFLPFSAGARNCIGQKYALLEIKCALCGILRKFTLEPVDTPATIKLRSEIVLRAEGDIKVKFVPRTQHVR